MSNPVRQRRVISDLAVTLDGFIEGKNGEVDWCIMDAEMGFTDFLSQIDTILYGRKSYELWGQFMPEKDVTVVEKELWEAVHSKEKYVFSRTQKTNADDNAVFISDNIIDEVTTFKEYAGQRHLAIWRIKSNYNFSQFRTCR